MKRYELSPKKTHVSMRGEESQATQKKIKKKSVYAESLAAVEGAS